MLGAREPTDPHSRLAGLLEAEQMISARRRRLQDQIDFIHGGGGADPNAKDETLRRLRAEEQKVSADRRKLQGEIDELRTLLGQPSPTPGSGEDTGSA